MSAQTGSRSKKSPISRLQTTSPSPTSKFHHPTHTAHQDGAQNACELGAGPEQLSPPRHLSPPRQQTRHQIRLEHRTGPLETSTLQPSYSRPARATRLRSRGTGTQGSHAATADGRPSHQERHDSALRRRDRPTNSMHGGAAGPGGSRGAPDAGAERILCGAGGLRMEACVECDATAARPLCRRGRQSQAPRRRVSRAGRARLDSGRTDDWARVVRRGSVCGCEGEL